MTKRTVTNQDRFVSTHGTGDWAVATKPDECIVPGSPQPRKFENWAKTEQLVGGTAKTTIGNESIWIKPGQLGPASGPEHAGIQGKHSQRAAHGEAKATTTSLNLFAEGEPVVRVEDKTLQNSGNTQGEVMTDLKRFQWEDASSAGGGAAARTADDGGNRKKPGRADKGGGTPQVPASGTEPVERCTVRWIHASCAHSFTRGTTKGKLQIVAAPGTQHVVKLLSIVDGPCLSVPEHTYWQVQSGPPLRRGRESEVTVVAPAAQAIGLLPPDTMSSRKPNTYTVQCVACCNAHQVEIEAYEPGTTKLEYTEAHKAIIDGFLKPRNFILSFIADAAEMGRPEGDRDIIKILHGTASGTIRVEEYKDHRAFVAFDLALDLHPLFQIAFRYSLVDLVVDLICTFAAGPQGAAAGRLAMRVGRRVIKNVAKRTAQAGAKLVTGLIRKVRLGGGKSDELKEKLAEMIEEEINGRLEEPDVYADIVLRFDLKGTIKHASPDLANPVQSERLVGTFRSTLGVGAEGKKKVRGRFGTLRFEALVQLWATTSDAVPIRFERFLEIWTDGVYESTAQPHLKVELSSPLGDFKPEQLDGPTATVKVKLPKMRIFPQPGFF